MSRSHFPRSRSSAFSRKHETGMSAVERWRKHSISDAMFDIDGRLSRSNRFELCFQPVLGANIYLASLDAWWCA
jgi:hypothetical protein